METGSAIRRIWTQGFELKQVHGAENVADMTLGNPVLPPPESLREALETIVANPPEDLHRYTPNAGHPEVRERIAGHLDARELLPGARGTVALDETDGSLAVRVRGRGGAQTISWRRDNHLKVESADEVTLESN